jgi:hypothetical protein
VSDRQSLHAAGGGDTGAGEVAQRGSKSPGWSAEQGARQVVRVLLFLERWKPEETLSAAAAQQYERRLIG